jgi:hypothetical protein
MRKRHPAPGRDDYSALASARRATPVLQKMGVQIEIGKASDRSRTRTIAITKRLAPVLSEAFELSGDSIGHVGHVGQRSGEIQGALAHDGRPKLIRTARTDPGQHRDQRVL